MLTTEMEISDFLTEYKRSRVIAETTVRATLNRALDFERKFNKPFYEFTKEEILEMYKSISAISVRSLQNVNLTLKHASRWIMHFKKIDTSSVYEYITKEMIEECIDIEKKENLIFTWNDLSSIQNDLLNWTDKGILEMLFLGAGGNWLKELTFFDMSQASRKEGVVYFRTGKVIPISEEQYELIKNACNETELISFGETSRISKVESHGFFKQRFNSLSDSGNYDDEQDKERRFRFIQRRLMLISKDIGVQLTPGGLQASGLLAHLRHGVQETGMKFRDYVKTEEAQKLAQRYDIFSGFYSQILIEKFEKHFI